MRFLLAVRLTLVLGLAFVLAAPNHLCSAQSTFSAKPLQATVGNFTRANSGTLTLSSQGVGFDSPDFVFTLPADDIMSQMNAQAQNGTKLLATSAHRTTPKS